MKRTSEIDRLIGELEGALRSREGAQVLPQLGQQVKHVQDMAHPWIQGFIREFKEKPWLCLAKLAVCGIAAGILVRWSLHVQEQR